MVLFFFAVAEDWFVCLFQRGMVFARVPYAQWSDLRVQHVCAVAKGVKKHLYERCFLIEIVCA